MYTEAINEMIEEIYSIFNQRDYPYTKQAVTRIVNEWYKQKAGLIELLSKYPNWNPDKFMIHFDSDYSRRVDVDTIDNEFGYIYHRIEDAIGKGHIQGLRSFLYDITRETLVDEYYANRRWEDIKRYFDFNLHNGERSSRVIAKMAKCLGINDKEWNQHYAKLADALNPLKTTRHTVLSVNLVDYLLMSNGNSWSSCHGLGSTYSGAGEYSSGTISYALDDVSMIFYTVKPVEESEDIELKKKVLRQVFSWNGEQLLQSRLYPQANDSGSDAIYTDVRFIVQGIIAMCTPFDNLWKTYKISSDRIKVEEGANSTAYPDFQYTPNCRVSIPKMFENKADIKYLTVGTEPICIECGCRHGEYDRISCCTDNREHCERCGDRIEDDESSWETEDGVVCDYCYDRFYSRCDCCDHIVSSEEVFKAENAEGFTEWVCDNCLGEYFTQCETCGNYYADDCINHVNDVHGNGIDVCDNCLSSYFSCCEECGEYYPDSCIDVDGFCNDCSKEKENESDEH